MVIIFQIKKAVTHYICNEVIKVSNVAKSGRYTFVMNMYLELMFCSVLECNVKDWMLNNPAGKRLTWYELNMIPYFPHLVSLGLLDVSWLP